MIPSCRQRAQNATAVSISGKQMPLGGPYLTSAQILMISQWISAGPQND
jgi:hypothetical protein